MRLLLWLALRQSRRPSGTCELVIMRIATFPVVDRWVLYLSLNVCNLNSDPAVWQRAAIAGPRIASVHDASGAISIVQHWKLSLVAHRNTLLLIAASSAAQRLHRPHVLICLGMLPTLMCLLVSSQVPSIGETCKRICQGLNWIIQRTPVPLPQISHLNGLTPVCTLIWRFTVDFCNKDSFQIYPTWFSTQRKHWIYLRKFFAADGTWKWLFASMYSHMYFDAFFISESLIANLKYSQYDHF